MSTTTLMVIQSDGSIRDVKEYRNSWGWAAMIWNVISEKYLGSKSAWLIGNKIGELWPLYKDTRLPLHWRVTLACTFDHAIISAATLTDTANHLRKFSVEACHPDCVNHLPEIADDIEKLPADCIGACFHGTSVSENPWRAWNQEKDMNVDYDITKDTDHFFVLESVLKEAEAPAAMIS